jgi:hypothetical protein
MRKIDIETNEKLSITFYSSASNHTITTTDDELYHALCGAKGYGPQQNYVVDLKTSLKSLHTALSRAIEEGDQLKIGIVLGQTITKLEELSK